MVPTGTHLGRHKEDFVLMLAGHHVLFCSSPGWPDKHHPVTLVFIREIQLLLKTILIENLSIVAQIISSTHFITCTVIYISSFQNFR